MSARGRRRAAWARATAPSADALDVAPTDDVTPTGDAASADVTALLPLDRSQLDALREHVEALLESGDCDQTHRATDAWAAGHGIALDRLHEGLEEYGGFCACEVVMNVDPAVVFDAGGQAAAGPSPR